MADFSSFRRGGVTYPLPLSGSGLGGVGAALLRDADPATFYLLEFVASVLNTHIGPRLVAEAVAANFAPITAAVSEQLPMNPEPILTEDALRFPLLAAYRKETTFRYQGTRKIGVDKFEMVYVLPPMQASEQERLVPILHAAVAVIDNRVEQGFDPAYTPSLPTGTAGEIVWSRTRGGLTRVEVVGVQYGAYTPTNDLYFPAVVLALTMDERDEHVLADLQLYNGADTEFDVADPKDGTVLDTVDTLTLPAPVAVGPLSPATGTKAGGTPVTIPCTGLVVGRSYRAIFAGADASNVRATSTTSLTCVTPQVAAYPTLSATVFVMDQDGQASNALTSAFTFTSP